MNRERWLRQRRTGIGASDAAAVVGVGKWGSPLSVYLDKIGEGEETEETERIRWGEVLEAPIAHEWARRVGATEVRKLGFRRHPQIPYIVATPDFEAVHPVDGRVLVEVKTSDKVSEWETEEGDQVPLQYYLQVQHQMLATQQDLAYLVVLIRGNDLRSWRVPRDAEIIPGLIDTYADFWSHVESRTPPEADGSEATAKALARLYPSDRGEEIVATPEEVGTVDALLAARRDLAEAEARKLLAENRLKERMATASRFLFPGGSISWKQNRPSERTNWEGVARAYREIIEDLDRQWGSFDALTEGRIEPPDGEELDTIRSTMTDTVPGARPFRITLKTEE